MHQMQYVLLFLVSSAQPQILQSYILLHFSCHSLCTLGDSHTCCIHAAYMQYMHEYLSRLPNIYEPQSQVLCYFKCSSVIETRNGMFHPGLPHLLPGLKEWGYKVRTTVV